MHKLLFVLLIAFFTNFMTFGQTATKSDLILGEITSMTAADQISLQTKDGPVAVILTPATVFKKVPPDNPKLSAAVDAQLSEIGTGDKIVVTGTLSSDKSRIAAKTVYLMTKAEILKKNNNEREEWKVRGIAGRIVSLNSAAREFTIAPRGAPAGHTILVAPKEQIKYRRYAPDSIKFDEAKTSSFAELKIGDQVRILGDKTTDGTGYQAEQVVSGSFKMVGGPILAIDVAKNEITIKDTQTNLPVTIIIKNNSLLRRFPPEIANSMAMQMGGNTVTIPISGHGGGTTAQPQAQSANSPIPAAPNGGQPVKMTFDELLEKFPVLSLSDLKVGDVVGASSTIGSEVNRVTAIKLLSGIEPFLKAAQMKNNSSQTKTAQGAGLSIPGLDGGMGNP